VRTIHCFLRKTTRAIIGPKTIVAAVNPAWQPFTTIGMYNWLKTKERTLALSNARPRPFPVNVSTGIFLQGVLDEVHCVPKHPDLLATICRQENLLLRCAVVDVCPLTPQRASQGKPKSLGLVLPLKFSMMSACFVLVCVETLVQIDASGS